MKKFVFAAIAVLAVTLVTLSLNAQPAGGGMGGPGGGMGGFGGGAGGGMMGGGMMGGQRGPVARPDKAARLEAIKTLETQIAALKAAIEKAPEKDTAVTAESDQATIDKATAERQAETDALTAVQTTLASLRGGRGGRGGMGASADVLSELRVLASGEKATKTIAKLDALIKEAQTTGGARGGRGGGMMGGGMMGGGMMGGGAGGMMGGGAGGPGAGAGRGGRGGAGGV